MLNINSSYRNFQTQPSIGFKGLSNGNRPQATTGADEKSQTKLDTKGKVLIGTTLTGLAALCIYLAARGKKKISVSKEVEQPLNKAKEEVKTMMTMTEDAQSNYTKTLEQCNGNISVSVNNKKSKELEDMAQFYEKQELASSKIKEFTYFDKETLTPVTVKKQGDKLLSKTTIEDGNRVLRLYDEQGLVFQKETFIRFGDSEKRFVTKYDRSTHIETEYFENIDFFIRKCKGDNVISKITIPFPTDLNGYTFDEAIKLSEKYEKMSVEELQALRTAILHQGNPQNTSELEFRFIESYLDFAKKNIPSTSNATQIKEHHYVHGRNHMYREVDEHNIGKTRSDYTEDELNNMSQDKYIEMCNNTFNKSRLEDMRSIDKEMSELPPLEKDCVFYRGVGKSDVPSILNGNVGDVVNPDKGYAYHGFDRSLAKEFSGGVILEVKTPKGARISRNMEHNGEALFPRNAEYKILSKAQTPDGEWRIELEYLLPKNQ